MKNFMKVLGALIVLVLVGTVVYLDVNTSPQPTRGELIDTVGLREPQELLSNPDDVAAICQNVGGEASIELDWVDREGVEQHSMVPCSKIKIDPIVPAGRMIFVFGDGWLRGYPEQFIDCNDGMISYLEMAPYGELGQNCGVLTKSVDEMVVYKESTLADPNNFLDGPWLEEVLIAVP